MNGTIDPKPRQVVALARAYGENPLSALIAAGYLSADDFGGEVTVTVAEGFDTISTDRLVSELQDRLEVIDQYLSWLEQLGGGRVSSAGLGTDALRYIRTMVAPAEVDGSVYISALRDRLEEIDVNGTPVFRPSDSDATSNVSRLDDHRPMPIEEDDALAAASERDGDEDPDADFDNA